MMSKSKASRERLHEYFMSIPKRRLHGVNSSRRKKKARWKWQNKLLKRIIEKILING